MAFFNVRRYAIMTMARRPHGNLIFQHRRVSGQFGSIHEAEETSGPGTTAHKTRVDKVKVKSESLLPMERICKLEEGLERLTSVVNNGFNRQERWMRWIAGFGVGTVLFEVLYHDGHIQDNMLEAIKDSKSELQSQIKDLKGGLQGRIKDSEGGLAVIPSGQSGLGFEKPGSVRSKF
ncbi:hypothetical protein HOY80DRAFT_1138595 [Tuber brumale]|nr:hypothetical protein HOY80DRAFT_1138595 [Tuber brumale]